MRSNKSRTHNNNINTNTNANQNRKADNTHNYASTRNASKNDKGKPIPIPRGPDHDAIKVVSRMKRKNETVKNVDNTNVKNYIPTKRSSSRRKQAAVEETEVIEIPSDGDDNENTPTQPSPPPSPQHIKKRRIIQRETESDDEELDSNQRRVLNKLRNDRKDTQERQARLDKEARNEHYKSAKLYEKQRHAARDELRRRELQEERSHKEEHDACASARASLRSQDDLMNQIRARKTYTSPFSSHNETLAKMNAAPCRLDVNDDVNAPISYIDTLKDNAKAKLVEKLAGPSSQQNIAKRPILCATSTPVQHPANQIDAQNTSRHKRRLEDTDGNELQIMSYNKQPCFNVDDQISQNLDSLGNHHYNNIPASHYKNTFSSSRTTSQNLGFKDTSSSRALNSKDSSSSSHKLSYPNSSTALQNLGLKADPSPNLKLEHGLSTIFPNYMESTTNAASVYKESLFSSGNFTSKSKSKDLSDRNIVSSPSRNAAPSSHDLSSSFIDLDSGDISISSAPNYKDLSISQPATNQKKASFHSSPTDTPGGKNHLRSIRSASSHKDVSPINVDQEDTSHTAVRAPRDRSSLSRAASSRYRDKPSPSRSPSNRKEPLSPSRHASSSNRGRPILTRAGSRDASSSSHRSTFKDRSSASTVKVDQDGSLLSSRISARGSKRHLSPSQDAPNQGKNVSSTSRRTVSSAKDPAPIDLEQEDSDSSLDATTAPNPKRCFSSKPALNLSSPSRRTATDSQDITSYLIDFDDQATSSRMTAYKNRLARASASRPKGIQLPPYHSASVSDDEPTSPDDTSCIKSSSSSGSAYSTAKDITPEPVDEKTLLSPSHTAPKDRKSCSPPPQRSTLDYIKDAWSPPSTSSVEGLINIPASLETANSNVSSRPLSRPFSSRKGPSSTRTPVKITAPSRFSEPNPPSLDLETETGSTMEQSITSASDTSSGSAVEKRSGQPPDEIDLDPLQPIGDDGRLLTYPYTGKKSVTIYDRDFGRLDHRRLLNDSLIDIFPKIWSDDYPTDQIHTFSSFFYTQLTLSGDGIDYQKVKRWTSKENIFEKSLVIIPVAQNNHWYLVVVSNPALCIKDYKAYVRTDFGEQDISQRKAGSTFFKPGKRLLKNRSYLFVLDPLHGDKADACEHVRDYLMQEALTKLGISQDDFIDPDFAHLDCPMQQNVFDCGVFCLHFIKSMYTNRDTAIATFYANKWSDARWEADELNSFRLSLKRLLKHKMRLFRQHLKETIAEM